MIKFIAKILPCDLPAQSGDIIPRKVLEDYLRSDECQARIDKGLVTGGMSHFSRKTTREGIPNADEILISGNIFFKATRVWMEGNFAMAEFLVFEDLKLNGEIENAYNTFLNMLRNGIRPPVSSCLRAFWDNNVCREIEFIRGVDVTLQPGFAGSEITQIIIS